jgi:hypothetical protein
LHSRPEAALLTVFSAERSLNKPFCQLNSHGDLHRISFAGGGDCADMRRTEIRPAQVCCPDRPATLGEDFDPIREELGFKAMMEKVKARFAKS